MVNLVVPVATQTNGRNYDDAANPKNDFLHIN